MDASESSKQRLRPWLEALVNSNTVEGLYWINAEKTKCRIPWYHGGKQGWLPERGRIFMEWARHTGRYREGIDAEEWVTWKTRLRCALNKASDIVEIKSESQTNVDCEEPFRVYEFKQRQSGHKKQVSGSRSTNIPTSDVTQCPLQPAPLPSVLDHFTPSDDMPSDLKQIDTNDLLVTDTSLNLSAVDLSDLSSLGILCDVQPVTHEQSNTADVRVNDELQVKLFYCDNVVVDQLYSSPSGCLIYYGEGHMPIESLPPQVAAALYSEPRAMPLWLPPCTDLMADKRMETHVQMVIERGMERGILVKSVNNNIVAYRLCKCSIFHASYIGTNGAPIKLPLVLRDKDNESTCDTVIFDYNNCFLPALIKYARNEAPAPDPRVFLLVGSEKRLDDIHHSSVPIYVTVTSARALHDLRTVTQHKQQTAAAAAMLPADLVLDNLSDEIKQMSLDSVDLQTIPDAWDLTGQQPVNTVQASSAACLAQDQLDPLFWLPNSNNTDMSVSELSMSELQDLIQFQ